MRVYGREELIQRAELLAAKHFCIRTTDLARDRLYRLKPPTKLSTIEYSEKHRIIRKPDGTQTGWKRELTPYLVPIMEAMDSPDIPEIVVPKPARSGGTVVAENYTLKMFEFGPVGDVMWYLAGPTEVSSYADRVFKPIFIDHTGIAEKIGKGPSDNKLTMKKIGAQSIELMAMSATTTTNRQAKFIVFDEPDSYNKKFASNFIEQGRQRQRMIGNERKIYACAHADIGWSGGIAGAWLLSSRGIFVMQCPECEHHASPYPTKHWPDVKQFRLHYQKTADGAAIGERLKMAERTAAVGCPHCGALLDESQRAKMVDEGSYMHEGQSLDVKAGIIGTPDKNQTWGFWVHVLMVKQVNMAELARELEGAIEHRERTGKTEKLKQVLVRTFGEVFEGAGDLIGLDARSLKERTKTLAMDSDEQKPVDYRLGEVPDGVRFATIAIDVGGRKFDILMRGWDNERRSWIIDRRTIRQRKHADGIMRDISPGKVIDDWDVLIDEIDRLYPMQSDPTKAMPVACMTIDASDGNTTWMAYEFARRMDGKRWGAWQRVRCIKGSTTATAPQLSPTPAKISKDSEGRVVKPVVTLHMLGVSKLKEDALEDLAISDATPGQIYFPTNFMDRHFEELFNEVQIEGKWVRNGDNETLDLLGYTEAARLMLEPDRKDRDWTSGKEPIWARPVSLTTIEEGGDLAFAGEVRAEKAKTDYAAMLQGMDRG